MNKEQLVNLSNIELVKNVNKKSYKYMALAVLFLAVSVSVGATLVAAAVNLAIVAGVMGTLGATGLYMYKSYPRWLQEFEMKEKERLTKGIYTHLENMKANAKKNPIEQAEAHYFAENSKLNVVKQKIKEIKGQIRTLEQKLVEMQSMLPRPNTRSQEDMLANLKTFAKTQELKYENALLAQRKFKAKIDEQKLAWEFQLTANEAIRMLDDNDKETMMNKMLTEAAFGEIQKQYNQAMSDIDMLSLETNSNLVLEAPSYSNDVIDVEVISHAR